MHLLHLPKLGYTMENGSITDWLVPEGTEFAVGDPLYEVETEKNVVQVEARLPGTLVKVVAPRDSELGVGGLVAVIADPGEAPSDDDVSALIAGDGDGHGGAGAAAVGGVDAAAAAGGVDDGAVAVSGPVTAGDAAGEPSAVGAGATGAADAAATASEGVDVTHQLDAPAEGPAALAAPATGRVRALPKVRAAAERLGVDLASLSGTGPRGTLTVDDVERAAAGAAGSAGATAHDADGAAAASGATGPTAAVRERRTLSGVGKAMAAGVSKSWSEVPQFVQQFSVDMTAVDDLRRARRESGERVGLTAVLLAAIARAVAVVPEVNASIAGTELTLFSDVNVAVAVNTERGLVVPPVAGVQSASLDEIEARVQKVVQDARSGSLPTDVRPTITLSNLGGFGVETGMPLVTAPQAAIVFTGDIVDRVVAVDGQVVVRPMLGIAVGYDHRIVDGATGGAFCQALREALEDPGWLQSAGGGSPEASSGAGDEQTVSGS